MVYEFKPKIDWNKGKALVWLLQALGLDQHEEVFTIYIGDDTTDEDAFAVFRCTANRKGM
jgi:trehalose 6-phosphate phosphatase